MIKRPSISSLFESAELSIPDLDEHNIRFAERRILWKKIAQALPPSQTPGQVALWNGQPPPSQTPEEVAQWNADLPPSQTEEQVAQWNGEPTGKAHIQPPVKAKPQFRPAAKPHEITLPEETIVGDPNEMAYTPGPDDPNYTGASKSLQGLLKAARYLSKKKS